MTTARVHYRPTSWWPALAAAVALLAAFDPAATWWFPSCPFHALTGWLCPLCGSLRAAHALLRGAPVAAFVLNPLTTTGFGACLVARRRVTSFCFSARGLALFTAFGLLRNLHGHPVWPGQ
jgi:hypothetical protein